MLFTPCGLGREKVIRLWFLFFKQQSFTITCYTYERVIPTAEVTYPRIQFSKWCLRFKHNRRCRFLMFCSLFHLNGLLLCLLFLMETFLQNLTTVNYFIYVSVKSDGSLYSAVCICKEVFLYSIQIWMKQFVIKFVHCDLLDIARGLSWKLLGLFYFFIWLHLSILKELKIFSKLHAVPTIFILDCLSLWPDLIAHAGGTIYTLFMPVVW